MALINRPLKNIQKNVVIVCGEGIKHADGSPVSASQAKDKFGNVEFGVIPAGSRLSLAPLHGFVMFDDEVIVETWAGEQTPHTAADAARFGAIFDRLRDTARYGEQVRTIIADALAHLPESAP